MVHHVERCTSISYSILGVRTALLTLAVAFLKGVDIFFNLNRTWRAPGPSRAVLLDQVQSVQCGSTACPYQLLVSWNRFGRHHLQSCLQIEQ